MSDNKHTYGPPKVWNGTPKAAASSQGSTAPSPVLSLLQLHSLATRNGVKVTIMLEELLAIGKDAEYDAYVINIIEGPVR